MLVGDLTLSLFRELRCARFRNFIAQHFFLSAAAEISTKAGGIFPRILGPSKNNNIIVNIYHLTQGSNGFSHFIV